jgi:hypothetical protein
MLAKIIHRHDRHSMAGALLLPRRLWLGRPMSTAGHFGLNASA